MSNRLGLRLLGRGGSKISFGVASLYMKIQSLKNVNITVLFSAPLNHLLISPDKITKFFITGDPQKDGFNFIEAPGVRVIIFPNQKKDVTFEPFRLIVSDRSGVDIEHSTIVSDFKKVFDTDLVDPSKMVAYGFNFDISVETEKGELVNIVGSKLLELPDAQVGGATVLFAKGGIKYVLDMKRINEKIYLVHLNVHFVTSVIPDIRLITRNIHLQFKELGNIIQNL